jgi:hypothetical protein
MLNNKHLELRDLLARAKELYRQVRHEQYRQERTNPVTKPKEPGK